MINDNGIRFSGEEFMELWHSSVDMESKYNELKRKFDVLQDQFIRLEFRVSKIEENIELEDESDEFDEDNPLKGGKEDD